YEFIHLCIYHETATSHVYTLSLHDALPISMLNGRSKSFRFVPKRYLPCMQIEDSTVLSNNIRIYPFHCPHRVKGIDTDVVAQYRSEEHTSELQSRGHLVCRLLLEKKKRGFN